MIIKNIRIVDDTQDFKGNITIENGIITAINDEVNGVDEVIDATDKEWVLLPAFTDLHVHFRDPGFTHKEDIETGSRAALRGGFTTVNLMPNTNPVASTMEIVRDIEKRCNELNLITAKQTLSMTKDLKGEDIEHLKTLKKEEILFVTDDGKGVNDTKLMGKIFDLCKERNIGIMCHAEASEYSATDMRMAENVMTERDCQLLLQHGGHLHFCHVSTKEAVAAIAETQQKGGNVTCETTPHHLFATGEEVNHYRVNPPFREKEDIDALIEGIKSGVICAIATDHAPHTAEEKAAGSPGMIGLELAFPLCYTKLVKENHIPLQHLIALMSTNPSKMMQLNTGKIAVGMDADLVIADLDNSYTIDKTQMASKSKNTPFDGRTVFGKVLFTIRKGTVHQF